MPFTPTYATADQLRDYTGDSTLTDEDALAVLRKAERDIDSIAVVGRPVDATTGLRFDPADLSDTEALALMRATCAQAEFRIEMGPEFFTRGQHAEVSGPSYSTKGTLGRIGPQVKKEMAGASIFKLTTTTTNRADNPRWWTPPLS